MKQFFLILVLVISLPLLMPAQSSRIHYFLEQKLGERSEKTLPVYAVLKERLPIDYLEKLTGTLPRKEKQKEVVRILKEFANEKQSNLLQQLNQLRSQDLVRNINPIWALNVIAFDQQGRNQNGCC